MNMIPCECEWNCGTLIPEFDKRGNKRRFVHGHQNRGKIPWNKGIPHSPKTRQLQSDANSGENHPMFGKHHSPKTKQLMSENRIGKYCGENSPMYGKHPSDASRQLMSTVNSGENNPNWQGGFSKEPYCPIWTPWLKNEIKERDDFQCQNPDCTKTSHKLMVHHIDYDKKNCSANNLITLCNSCNSRANFNREHWKEFYNNILGKSNSYDCPNQSQK